MTQLLYHKKCVYGKHVVLSYVLRTNLLFYEIFRIFKFVYTSQTYQNYHLLNISPHECLCLSIIVFIFLCYGFIILSKSCYFSCLPLWVVYTIVLIIHKNTHTNKQLNVFLYFIENRSPRTIHYSITRRRFPLIFFLMFNYKWSCLVLNVT